MLETFNQYIDLELAIIILVAILSAIFLNVLFKKVSMPVFVHWLVIIIVVCGIGYFGLNFFEKEQVAYLDSLSNNYVVGKVQFVGRSVDKVNLKFLSSNIPIKNKEVITVDINTRTKFLLNGEDKKNVRTTIDEIKVGDIVTVYCKESSTKTNETIITAIKIVKKES